MPPEIPLASPKDDLLSKAPVLVVDDDENLLRTYANFFARLKVAVTTVSSVEEALRVLDTSTVGCVVTDLRMPKRDGHELIGEIRKRTPDLPIIVVSGVDSIEDAISCMRNGVIDFLRKPVVPAQLKELIERVLDRPSTPAKAPDASAPSATAPAKAINASAGSGLRRASEDADWSGLMSVLKRLRDGEMPIPALPGIILELRRVLRNSEVSPSRIKALVETDAHITLRLLRMANSAVYTGVDKVTDVRSAIVRIGVPQTAQIIDAIVAQRFFAPTSPEARKALTGLWRHSLVRAQAMHALALERKQVAPDTAHLAGLFADVGASFLFRIIAEVLPNTPQAKAGSFVAEHHTLVGATIAEAWNLPPDCIEVCRNHHAAIDVAGAAPSIQLLMASEAVAQELGVSSDLAPISGVESAVQLLGVSKARISEIAAELKARLNELSTAFEAGA